MASIVVAVDHPTLALRCMGMALSSSTLTLDDRPQARDWRPRPLCRNTFEVGSRTGPPICDLSVSDSTHST